LVFSHLRRVFKTSLVPSDAMFLFLFAYHGLSNAMQSARLFKWDVKRILDYIESSEFKEFLSSLTPPNPKPAPSLPQPTP
jgi:hypothetical protein